VGGQTADRETGPFLNPGELRPIVAVPTRNPLAVNLGVVLALATCDNMVADLCRLALLDAAQAEEAAALGLQCADGRELAKTLVRRGWLTVFQVNKLLQYHANDLLIGPYLLLERLGEGGMGQVFKARHRSLGRVVALKVIRKEALTNPTAARRFEREVQANAQLTHPNVVRAFDAGQAGGTYYLAMEFIEGIDLALLVKREGPLTVARACDYIRQAAQGLEHMHQRGFIHRDIKPANLLVTRKLGVGISSSALLPRPVQDAYAWGIIKILDFGLARLQVPDPNNQQVALTQQGTVMGTPDFLAPEQAWDAVTSDIRADLYSLGCTFYWLLAGEVPFPCDSVPEKLIKQRKANPEPVAKVRREQLQKCREGKPAATDAAAEVTAQVAAVLEKLLAKKPGERFQTPGELLQALAELQPSSPAPTKRLVHAAAKTPLPRVIELPCHDTPSMTSSGEATIVVPRKKAGLKEKQTTQCPCPGTRRSRVRHLLVYAGFLLCCALANRFLATVPLRAGDEAPAAPAPAAVKPAGKLLPPPASPPSVKVPPGRGQ
jgi:serine/threonine protein kinase